MLDAVTLVALAVLVVAIITTIVPGVPSGAVALLAVYVEFFFGSGDRIGVWLLLSFTLVGVLAVAIDLFGGPIAARAKGASQRTTYLAAGAGLVLLFVAGPVGIVVGMFGTVLLAGLYDERPFDEALDNAVWATAGMLVSGAAVFLLVLSMLVAYVVFVLWLGGGFHAL